MFKTVILVAIGGMIITFIYVIIDCSFRTQTVDQKVYSILQEEMYGHKVDSVVVYCKKHLKVVYKK